MSPASPVPPALLAPAVPVPPEPQRLSLAVAVAREVGVRGGRLGGLGEAETPNSPGNPGVRRDWTPYRRSPAHSLQTPPIHGQAPPLRPAPAVGVAHFPPLHHPRVTPRLPLPRAGHCPLPRPQSASIGSRCPVRHGSRAPIGCRRRERCVRLLLKRRGGGGRGAARDDADEDAPGRASGPGLGGVGTTQEGIQEKVCSRRPPYLRAARAGPEVTMAAEGLWGPGGPPGWELDGWYQDLQEVLAAEPPGTAPTWGAEQAEPGTGGCGLDVALAEELLELLGPEGAEPAEPPAAAPGGSGSARPGPAEEEEEEEAAQGARRKRRGGPGAPRERDGERRQRDGERRVRELTAHNERLRAEIQRLSAEVQRTRAALIDRIVNLRQV